MADNDFDFDDKDQGGEANLDDFFEPAGEEGEAAGSLDDFFAADEEAGKEESLPVERDRVPVGPEDAEGAGEPLEAETAAPPEPAEEEPGEAEAPAEKGFLARNWMLIAGLGLVIALGGAGGFFAFKYFFAAKPEAPVAVAKSPVKKPAPKKAPKKKPKTIKAGKAGEEAETGLKLTPGKTRAEEAGKTAETGQKPAQAVKPAAPAKKAAEKKSPVKTAQKQETAPVRSAGKTVEKREQEVASAVRRPPVMSTGGPYSVQVGAYMLEASKKGPEDKLRALGYSGEWRYVPLSRTLTVYHVYAGKGLSREEASELMAKLEDLGYMPELVREDGGFRVLVYSYGSSRVASSTRSKLKSKGIKDVRVVKERKRVTLDQLRVGRYSSRTLASKALADLKKNGFRQAIIVKE